MLDGLPSGKLMVELTPVGKNKVICSEGPFDIKPGAASADAGVWSERHQHHVQPADRADGCSSRRRRRPASRPASCRAATPAAPPLASRRTVVSGAQSRSRARTAPGSCHEPTPTSGCDCCPRTGRLPGSTVRGSVSPGSPRRQLDRPGLVCPGRLVRSCHDTPLHCSRSSLAALAATGVPAAAQDAGEPRGARALPARPRAVHAGDHHYRASASTPTCSTRRRSEAGHDGARSAPRSTSGCGSAAA